MARGSVVIIEPIAYVFPHKKELVATSSSMKGVWSLSVHLLKKDKNSFLAPLLIDDLRREGFITYQTIDDLLQKTLDVKYSQLAWLGESVAESDIYKQYGNLGCKTFDQIYHRDVILPIMTFDSWKWVVVHPVSFMGQQVGMLEGLFKLIFAGVSFSQIARAKCEKTEDVRNEIRTEFFDHFIHYWIDEDGSVSSITKPVYEHKGVSHKEV